MSLTFGRALLLLACVAATAGPGQSSVSAQSKAGHVNVYNWSDYIAPGVIKDFETETGISVTYDTFDDDETLQTKLLAGNSGYDLVVPSGDFLAKQIKAGIFQKLDKSQLPNLGNAWDLIAGRVAVYDPGNQYAVNYMWGTTGIGYNVTSMHEVLGPNGSIDSWDHVFKPEDVAKFKECGVDLVDSGETVMALALNYLSFDPNSANPADLRQAAGLLMKVRPYIRKFESSEYLNALASGEICLAVGYSGDIKQAQTRAAQAKSKDAIGYVIPKEGSELWFDNLAIPKDAGNVNQAHALINYLLRPEIAARNTNHIGYANGNAASRPMVDPAILADPTIYPDEATMNGLYSIMARDDATARLIGDLWAHVKAGY